MATVQAAAGGGRGTQVSESKESKNKRWKQFVAGLLIEIAVVAYDIYSLRECSREDASKYTDRESGEESKVRDLKLAVMILSLAEEVLSSLYLSYKYDSPLDLKTMHTLPQALKASGTFAYCAEVLPLGIFGLISMMVAFASRELSKYNGCGGPTGDSLNGFLFFCFIVYVILGAIFLYAFVLKHFVLCCQSIVECMQDCCWDRCCGDPERRAAAREQAILARRDHLESSKTHHIRVATMFELSWQFIYLLWAFHAGAIGVGVVVFLALLTVVGIWLVAVGTQAFAEEAELWIGRTHTVAGA